MRDRRVRAFLAIAGEELSAARGLKDNLPRQAAYFLQQTVEKLVRAVLEYEGIPAGTAHNLLYLAGLLPADHPLRQRFAAFEHLSAAATRYRYPGPSGAVSAVPVETVNANFDAVSTLHDEVAAWLKRRLNKDDVAGG